MELPASAAGGHHRLLLRGRVNRAQSGGFQRRACQVLSGAENSVIPLPHAHISPSCAALLM